MDPLMALSPELVTELDREARMAIDRVRENTQEREAITVGLTLTIGRDKNDEVVVTYAKSYGRKRKGSWTPPAAGQLRMIG